MKEQKIRDIYIWMISICGFILTFLSPPFTVPDEHTHFINAYCASQFNYIADIDENTLVVGKYIPRYIAEFTKKYRENYANNFDGGYDFASSYFDSWIPVSDDDRELVFWEGDLVTINPISYIISAFGMTITSVFCHICGGGFDTAYNLMLAGRFANLIFYILVGYTAIRITPCLKKTMMLILAMPMSLFLGASLSYDAILIPISMLFFAELMKLCMDTEDGNIGIKDIFIISMCVLFLVGVKKYCAPFILLLLFVPRVKFKSVKQYIISIGIVIIVGIIAISPIILSRITTQDIVQVENPNVLLQKEYFYSNLQLFPIIFINTFKEYSNFYLSGFVAKLGLLDTNFPIIYIGIFWIVLLSIAFAESCGIKKIDIKLRIFTPLIIIFILVVLFAGFYTSHTALVEKPFGTTVSGVQGRYFIPMFCFGCVIMFNNLKSKLPQKIVDKGSIIIRNVTKFFIIINCILTLVVILLRYWCN